MCEPLVSINYGVTSCCGYSTGVVHAPNHLHVSSISPVLSPTAQGDNISFISQMKLFSHAPVTSLQLTVTYTNVVYYGLPVLQYPVIYSIIRAIAHHQHGMVGLPLAALAVAVDATVVVLECDVTGVYHHTGQKRVQLIASCSVKYIGKCNQQNCLT